MAVIKVVRPGVDQHITAVNQGSAAIETELQRMDAALKDPGLTWDGKAWASALGALDVLKGTVINPVATNRR